LSNGNHVLVAAHHVFPHAAGTFSAGEASYERNAGQVTMHVTGMTPSTYVHSDLSWLALGSMDTPYGVLAWEGDTSMGSTHITVFTMVTEAQRRAVPFSLNSLSLGSETGGNEQFDLRWDQSRQLQAHTTAQFEVRNLYRIGSNLYLDTGKTTVSLPLQPLYQVATSRAYMAIKSGDMSAIACALRREGEKCNMSPVDLHRFVVLGTPLVLVLSLADSEKAYIQFVMNRLGSIKRYNDMLELKYAALVVPLKLVLLFCWLVLSAGWWGLVGGLHWSGWWALLPFTVFLLVALILIPWRWLLQRLRTSLRLPLLYRRIYGYVRPYPVTTVVPGSGRLRVGDAPAPLEDVVVHHVAVEVATPQGNVTYVAPDVGADSNVADSLVQRLLTRDTVDLTVGAQWLHLQERIYQSSDSKKLTPFGSRFFSTANDELPQVVPLSYDEWKKCYNAKKQASTDADMATWRKHGSHISDLGRRWTIFVKAEASSKAKPRNIISPRMAFHGVVGPTVRPLGNLVADQIWHRASAMWYTQGASPETLGEWMASNTRRLTCSGRPPVSIWADASSFEASVHENALRFRFRAYKAMGTSPDVYSAMMSSIAWAAAAKGGTAIGAVGKTASGVDDTSLGNTFVSSGPHVEYFLDLVSEYNMRDGDHWAGLGQGDDLFFLVSADLYDKMGNNLDKLQIHVAKYGLTFEYGSGVCDYDHAIPADFCSGFFFWYKDGSCLWGTKPMRAATKSFLVDGKALTNDDINKQIKATALSLAGRSKHLPVLRAVVALGIKQYDGFVDVKPAWSAVVGGSVKVAPSWDYCARLYGVEIADLQALEREVQKFPVEFSNSTASIMLRVEGVEFKPSNVLPPARHHESDVGVLLVPVPHVPTAVLVDVSAPEIGASSST